MFDSGVYCYELSEEQQRLFVRFEKVNPEYAARCAKRSEDMRALAHFLGCSDRRYEKHLDSQKKEQCKKCDFYSGQSELLCAVHPGLKHECTDFQPKQDRPPIELQVTSTPRKWFDFTELNSNQFLYCCLVWGTEDWHHEAFRDFVIIQQREYIAEVWSDHTNPKVSSAANISEVEVLDLQEKLQRMSGEEMFDFLHAIGTLALTAFY